MVGRDPAQAAGGISTTDCALSVDGQSEGVADRQRRRRQRCLSDARGPVGLRRLRRRLRLQSVRGGERADAERRQAVTWAEEKVRTEESG